MADEPARTFADERISGPGQVLAAPGTPVRVWDWPVRLVHWSVALLVPALWWTAHHDALDWHKRLALVLLALVGFRLIWGLVGGGAARFTSFIKGPRGVLAYLRAGSGAPTVGHNPLGGWSVAMLLGLLTAQLATGLVTQDSDGLESGPLNHYVTYENAELARAAHGLAFNLLLAFIVLHLAAIAWYRFARADNLVTPMLSGDKRFAAPVVAPRRAPRWALPLAALAAGLFALWLGQGAPLPF